MMLMAWPRASTSGRASRAWAAMNVATIASTPQLSTGPPAERL